MASYQSFIFSAETAQVFWPKARAAVETYCRKAGRPVSLMADTKRMRVEYGREEYYFYLSLFEGEAALAESEDIARSRLSHPWAKTVANCAYRIEFSGDDDPDMDYFNEYFALMEELVQGAGAIVFDYPSGKFFGT